ncbi:hypothetical protein ACG9YY_05055 [Acinetobacter pittii]|uniref:hypothetical protein n=1 Tax=Acinetobacter pittii TaxID=48296 RepID=UPI003AF49EE5
MVEKVILAFVSALLAIMGSFLLEYYKSSKDQKKRSADQWKVDLEAAEKSESIFNLPDNNRNRLIKDRFAKFLLRNDNATFKDLKLLLTAKNLDYGSDKYFKSKKFFNIIEDGLSGDYVLLTYDTSKYKIRAYITGYFVLAMMASIPYIFSVQLNPVIRAHMDSGSYTLLILIVLSAFTCLAFALYCLFKVRQEYSASQFVQNFYQNGVHHR